MYNISWQNITGFDTITAGDTTYEEFKVTKGTTAMATSAFSSVTYAVKDSLITSANSLTLSGACSNDGEETWTIDIPYTDTNTLSPHRYYFMGIQATDNSTRQFEVFQGIVYINKEYV